jgi:hypothetical protein
MAYIGNIPAVQYASFSKQTLTADSSTVAFTLDNAVANENEIEVFVNNVRQEPGSGKAYTASGTTLTMSAAPTTGDSFYVIFQGKATQTVTAPSGSVGLSQLSATGTKDATTFLRGDNTFASAGGTNTPAFQAILSSDQSIAHNTTTTILFDSEVFDTDSAYDPATGKFQPQTAGKYYIYTILRNDGTGTYEVNTRITKNGSDVVGDNVTDNEGNASSVAFTTVDLNGSSDYVIVTIYQPSGGAKNIVGSATDRTYFGAYKLIE